VKGEIFVGAAESCDEMILERPDGAFGGVLTMDVGRDKLKIDILRAHELFEDAGAFIIKAL
jgi:hypothetical protein